MREGSCPTPRKLCQDNSSAWSRPSTGQKSLSQIPSETELPVRKSRTLLCCSAGFHDAVSAPFQTSLFGEGTYLTSDLSLALLYSPHGLGWQRSALGSVLSCVAVCEIIDHPDVKCQVKKKGESVAVITMCSSSHTGPIYFSFAHTSCCIKCAVYRARTPFSRITE